ncbi:MAG: serine/threonine protein kinase [Myxococcaceae bacterium]|nr:serine/threonine protein kinase [Myxococcaceae bacterium]
MADAKPADLEAGEVLNNTYRLDALIGQGGMGRVFAATDLKLQRKVAVKALHAANLDAETVRRFDRETQVMGQLDHPGVVTLFAFGRTHQVPWLAMRFLEGADLWALLASAGGRMTPQNLLPVVRQILAALAYLHGRGLLHRDLKPSNIHVGKTGKVTLCDLGLARGHQSSLTRTGIVWGTPDYMAPEQILGERELDGRADLYALGVVIYRMLAGQAVFTEKDEQDLLRAHLTKPRPDVSRLVPTLSPLVGAALQKAIAIHAEDRFQTAQEMGAAMELVLALPLVAPRALAPAAPRPSLLDDDETGLDDDALVTRPAGFAALEPDGEGVTNRDGFAALPVTTEGSKVTQPVEAVSAPTPVNVAPAQTLVEEGTAVAPAARPNTSYSPVNLVVLIGAAVVLFVAGLLVAKFLL